MNGGENGELPEGWALAKLGELIKPSSEKIEPTERPDAPYLSLEHIAPHSGEIIGRGSGSDVNSTKAVFRGGDVLYGKLRPYLNKVTVPDFDGICSTDILVFRQQPWIDSRFLRHFLSTPAVVEFANHNSTGVQLPRISFDTLGAFEMPFPPMAEQRRIVAAVEAVLVKVNAARDRLNRVPAILKRFRQSVLSAACSGRLTAEWREHAEANCREQLQIDWPKEEKTGKQRRMGRLWGGGEVPPLTDEERDSVPIHWRWAKVAELGNGSDEAVQVGPMSMQSRDFEEDGVPVLNVGCIQTGWFDKSKLDFMPASKAEAFDRYRIKGGDILFTRSGTIGRCAVATAAEDGYLMTFHLLRVRPSPAKVFDDYMSYVFQGAAHTRRQMEESAIGSTRAGFNTSLLAGLDIPVPSLPEQREIIRRVGELFALADRIEDRLVDARQMADRLTQAVLAKAFRGELVPTEAALARRENRPYEPAADLLARIRKEKNDSIPLKSRKAKKKLRS